MATALAADYLGAFLLADAPPPTAEVEAADDLDGLVVALARRVARETERVVLGLSDAELERALSGHSRDAEAALTASLEDALVPVATGGLEAATLLGALHVERLAADAGVLELSDVVLPGNDEAIPFEEAADALRSRVAVEADEFYELADALRFRAFTVSAISSIDVLRTLQEELATHLEGGRTFPEFAARARSAPGMLNEKGLGPLTPWRWETVWRTNATAAQTAGRWAQIRSFGDDVALVEFVAIEDTRTTDVCRSYAGIVRPPGDPVWSLITPPNHFNCRSTLRPIFAGTEEARQLVVTPDGELAPDPQEGFEASPADPAALREIPRLLRERAEAYGLTDRIAEQLARLERAPSVRDRIREEDPDGDWVDGLPEVESLTDLDGWFGAYRRGLRRRFDATRAADFDGFSIGVDDRPGALASIDWSGALNLSPAVRSDLVRALRSRLVTVREADAVFTLIHEVGHVVGENGGSVGPDGLTLYGRDVTFTAFYEGVNELWAARHAGRLAESMGLRWKAGPARRYVDSAAYAAWVSRIERVMDASGVRGRAMDALVDRLWLRTDPRDFSAELVRTALETTPEIEGVLTVEALEDAVGQIPDPMFDAQADALVEAVERAATGEE